MQEKRMESNFFKQKVFICRFAFLGAESFESKRKKDLLALPAQFTSRAADPRGVSSGGAESRGWGGRSEDG